MLIGQLRSATVTPPNVGFRFTSSSVTASTTGDGFPAIPCPLEAVADTLTDLSWAASSPSSTADTVTTPPLTVVPAATVNVVLPLNVKSVATVCGPAEAATVNVVGWLDGRFSVAVTVATPPLSEIDEGVSTSATAGASSSSVMVRVLAAGFATPLAPDTVAETCTDSSGASVVSSVAVRVTAPVLVVTPAAMVSVAPVCATGPDEVVTVRVTTSLEARFRVAVTVAMPPFSEMESDDRARVAVGVASSSVRVRGAPVTVPMP